MVVPNNILRYCDELAAKVNTTDEAVLFTQSDFAKLLEVQSWYVEHLTEQIENPEPTEWPAFISDNTVNDIVERMHR